MPEFNLFYDNNNNNNNSKASFLLIFTKYTHVHGITCNSVFRNYTQIENKCGNTGWSFIFMIPCIVTLY